MLSTRTHPTRWNRSPEVLVDEDRDDILEEMTLEQREEALKRSRWNVFMFLGIAVILFGFALFPMPFSADYQTSIGGLKPPRTWASFGACPSPATTSPTCRFAWTSPSTNRRPRTPNWWCS